jgi:putative addiction module antidote
MTQRTTLRKIGGSLGMILPKSLADSLALEAGDEVFITDTPEGIFITPYDPDFAETMADAREFMRTHRNAFRELAK